ncbi:MAG TPA: VOC family protein [Hyphomicrobiaceae bacterium]|nr:VOC family protein [Hyphomicrobiaceae bacterium]
MPARVSGLRAVAAAVVDLDEAARFYTEVWHLELVERTADSAYFRGTDSRHHILSLHRAPRPALIRIILDAADRRQVEELHAAVRAAAVGPVEPPGAWRGPGRGYGFGFKDPEGRNFAIVAEVADHQGPGEDKPDRPRKVAHVNLNAADCEGTCRFLIDVLGFRLSDETVQARFVRCDSSHNNLVIGTKGPTTLNHVAFEMPDLDSVMRGAGRMRDNGYPIEWGVGRHGPGNNVFAYFLGPEEFPIEYTAETLVVGDDHVPRGPDYWKWPPGRTDRWGVTDPLSKRFQRVQRLFGFTQDGYRTHT